MMDATWKWKLTDKRTADRYVEKGILSKADYEKHLKSLPDESANATWVEMSIEETDLAEPMDDENDDLGDEDMDLAEEETSETQP